MTTALEQAAIEAAENHVIETYTMLTRNDTKHWGFDDKELAKLRYNDAPGKQDGYLIAGIESSRIIEHVKDDDGEEWIVEVVPEVGVGLEPEVYRVYQGTNGDWIVESE
jgi:hypothetical protein